MVSPECCMVGLRLVEIKVQLRAASNDEAAKARAVYQAERLAAGHPVAWSEDGERIVLEGSHEIELTGGETVTVAEILADPARFHRMACADPGKISRTRSDEQRRDVQQS